MKTSLSLTDREKRIAERLKQRLGLDSLSETVAFALRDLGGRYGVIDPEVVGSNGGALDRATEAPVPESEALSYATVPESRWGYGVTGRVTDPFKIAAKNMGRPVAFVSFKKAILDAYAAEDDPTERVYIEKAAELSRKMGIPVPPTVVSWHLSGHKRWRRLFALARHAIEKHGEAAFQAAAEAIYSGNPQPMLDLLYPRH